MDLCLLKISRLKNFVLNPVEQESQTVTFTIGGYEYQFNFVVQEFKVDEVKVKGEPRKLRVRWDRE